MTPEELIDSLPEGLQNMLKINLFDGEMVPTTGFSELREVAKHVYLGTALDKKVLGAAESKLPDWLTNQEAVQVKQEAVLTELLDKHPLDDPTDIPDWPFLPWGKIIREDWSGDLAGAVTDAENYLANPDGN